MPAKTKSIDDYLGTIDGPQRNALQALRREILSIVPKAEECISYGMPAFRLKGKGLVAFAAAANHCSLYPMSGSIVEQFADALQDFETSKGTIRFQPDRPIPKTLLRRILRARILENER